MEPLGTSLPHVRNVAVELSNGVRTPATSSCSNQGSVVKRDNGQVIDHQETGVTIFQSKRGTWQLFALTRGSNIR